MARTKAKAKIKCVKAVATEDRTYRPSGGPLRDGVYEVPRAEANRLAEAKPASIFVVD